MALTLKQARNDRRLSQKEIAEKLDVHRQTYMKWEKTPELMPIKAARKFSEIVQISVDEIKFF